MGTTSISEVAALAGVSETTVSHAISGRRPVSAATLARVNKAIEQLGYRPNRLASGLRSQRTHTTALIVPDINNPFYPAVARGLQDALGSRGYQYFICSTDGLPELEDSFLADAIDRRVDGIVFAPAHAAQLPPSLQTSHGIPTVLLSASAGVPHTAIDHPAMDIVRGNDERGMQTAAQYLIERGHTRIGFINAPLDTGPARRRFEGYLAAMSAAGLPVDDSLMTTTAFTREGGRIGLELLMATEVPPTAVLCGNDLIAIGALDHARERRMTVPGEISIVGYDDIEASSLVSPPLTTVSNPAREIGHACGKLLLDRMTGEYDSNSREVTIANSLIVRGSA